MHVNKVHHTKTIYKVIEKPIYVDANQLLDQVDVPQSSSEIIEETKTVGHVYSDKQTGKSSSREPNGHGNKTIVPESVRPSIYTSNNNAAGHENRSKNADDYYNTVTSRYHDRGIESKNTHEPEGFLNGQSGAAQSSDGGGNERGSDLGRDDDHWHRKQDGQRIHPRRPNLYASDTHRGFRKPYPPIRAYHGHVADDVVWRVVGDRKPKHVNDHKPKYVNSPKHGHFVKAWRGQEISVPALRKYSDFNAFSREPNKHDKFNSRGGYDSNNKNVIPVGNVAVRGPQISGYINAFPAGHPDHRNDHRTAGYQNMFGRSNYGPRGTGGSVEYLQANENADAFPSAAFNRNHSWPDALISTVAFSPQVVKNVYFTLEPVVPYNDVTQPLK